MSVEGTRRRQAAGRRRRAGRLLAVACAGWLCLTATGCGSTSSSGARSPAGGTTSHEHIASGSNAAVGNQIGQVHLQVTSAGSLPVPVLGNALAVSPDGHVVSVGGYTGRVSITEVYEIAPSVQQSAKMPTRAHDAAAGFLGHDLYVFGGGQATSTDTVFRLAHGVATLAGRLSSPLSDAVCVPYRWHGIDGLLLIGGYDDKHYRQTIDFVSLAGDTLRYQPVARIPVGLRYTAAATDGRAVYLAGGRTPSGLSREVYEVRPDTGEVRAVAALPEELQKCAAFWVDSRLIVVGGLTASGTPTADVLAVDPRTAAVQRIGRLPVPLADMGYAQQGAIAYLAGGKTRASDASVTGAIWKLRFTH